MTARRLFLTAAAFLALSVGAGARAADADVSAVEPAREVNRHATFSFGTLGGKRHMLQSASHLYYLSPEKELCIAEKPGSLPAGGEAKSPAPVGKLKLGGVPESLEWINDTTLCVGTGNHLALVEVGKPREPRLAHEIEVAFKELDGVSETKRAGKSLYVAARRQGIFRVDVADPARPRKGSPLRLRGWALSVEEAAPGLLAVATGTGISFIRVKGEGLEPAGSIDTLRRAEIVRVLGKRLVSASKEYLTFWDISNPARPVELAEVSTRDPFFYTHHMALHLTPDLAYAAACEGGLYLYDWRDAKKPRLLVQYSFWQNERRLDPARKAGYLSSLGLPSSPEDVRRQLPQAENEHITAVGMAVDGSRVYLADHQGRIWGLEVETGPEPSARCFLRP